MNKLSINNSWTLFLDRDGVINRRIPDVYISDPEEFEFLPGVLDALAYFSRVFRHLIVVTNQQGIGKGLLTTEELEAVHSYMLKAITAAGGMIGGIYYCGEPRTQVGNCRKPSPAMAHQAREDFHDIDFEKSIMVGDTMDDIIFGQNLGIKTFLVGEKLGYAESTSGIEPDYILEDLASVKSMLVLV